MIAGLPNKENKLQTDAGRRAFISRQLLGAGACATTALLGRSEDAAATPLCIINDRPRPCHCFLRNTHIQTPYGQRKIEDLQVGDLVSTQSGNARPIQRIWRSVYRKYERAWGRKVQPICIVRSALAPNVPSRDLFLSPGHGLFLDGLLIPASSLVNGTSIVRYRADSLERLEYFHIKLASHDVILAEGAPCETFLRFDESDQNYVEFQAHGGAGEVSTPYAPYAAGGARAEIASRLRRIISQWYECRTPLDRILERLESRGNELLQSCGSQGEVAARRV